MEVIEMKKALFTFVVAGLMFAFLAFSGNTTTVFATSLPSLPGPTTEITADDVVDLDTLNQWLDTRSAYNADDVEMFMYGDNRREELQHILREGFEQLILPVLMYQYQEDLYDIISNARTGALLSLLDEYWNFISLQRVREDLRASGIVTTLDEVVELFSVICDDCGNPKLFDLVAAYGLRASHHIVELAFIQVGEYGNIAIIRMHDTGWLNISTYVALTFIDNAYGRQVFNLERMDEDSFMIVAVHDEDYSEDLGIIDIDDVLETGLDWYELFLYGILEALDLTGEEMQWL